MGVVAYDALLPLGILGAILLFRRGSRLALGVLLVPVVVASVTAMATYGLLRLRHIAEISLIVLAGIAVAHAIARRARSRARRTAPA
jgi:hypothetical protein